MIETSLDTSQPAYGPHGCPGFAEIRFENPGAIHPELGLMSGASP